jgi:anaerobic selenocysteine-containing dehydrogenase
LFLTPTAELADIVLPVTMYLEMDNIHARSTASVIQKVSHLGECWSDHKILNELGKRLGLGKHFWNDEMQMLDFLMKPSGLTFDEFRDVGFIEGNKAYRQYDRKAFNTPSGKVELYSSQLEKWGFDPLPVFYEPPESPFSSPELAQEYPLVMTSSKIHGYIHSGGRQIRSLRVIHPDPLVAINKKTARTLGINDGDWIYIETKRGRIKQKAKLSSRINRRVVVLEHGWWFPEKEAEMHGWAESNINVLTSNDPPYARELGSVTFRGIVCKVYKT